MLQLGWHMKKSSFSYIDLAALSFLFVALGNYVAATPFEQDSLELIRFLSIVTAKMMVISPILLSLYVVLVLDAEKPVRQMHYIVLLIPTMCWAYIIGLDMHPLWGEWGGWSSMVGWLLMLAFDLLPLGLMILKFSRNKRR